jgi:flagellar biosynthesis protein FliP
VSKRHISIKGGLTLGLLCLSADAYAALPSQISADSAQTVRTAILLGLMAFLPALIMCMTSFVRIVIVLSMIRHAFGMPETPPNTVLVSLSLFLTALSMGSTLERASNEGLRPFLANNISAEVAMEQTSAPLREFMLAQVKDRDLKAIYSMTRKPLPSTAAEVGLLQLTSAFMLNELRVAFTIGFVVLLPFLLIDLVVSAILLSLGMLMVPPATISLPLKILMFVLIDGWSLVLQGVVGSFK